MSLLQKYGAVRPPQHHISLRPDAASTLPCVAEIVTMAPP